ncbi:MAG: hypothetical protein ABSG72_11820 [Candidatus Sulfotelmatobacter sp.]|jgi:hypothetical protein
MIAILPVSLLADDAAAMLRSNGIGVLVNKNPAPASIALFSNDFIETEKAAIARVEETGSTADINPETMVQYQTGELVLDHGSLSVNTSRGLKVRVGCLMVTPVNDAEWTHYDVTDVDGKLSVSALKLDVYIDVVSASPERMKQPAHSNRIIVHEGEQKSRGDRCGVTNSLRGPVVKPLLDSPYAIGSGIGIITVLTCWALCRTSNPLSPKDP